MARKQLGPVTRSSLAVSAAIAILVALISDQVWRIGDFRVDDAYITFSFSKNLAEGHGPVYSHGLRVEGYSNFLWMVVTAAGYFVAPTLDPYFVPRLLAFACLGFGLYLVYQLARRQAGPLLAFVAPLMVVTCSDVLRATLSGLETVPFAVAIVFGWWVYLDEPASRRRWSLLAFVPAALLRIDGFVPLLIVAGFEIVDSYFDRRFSMRGLVRWALPAVAVWAVYFAWRHAYYGLPLPATYYAKSLVALHDPDRGWDQAWSFLREYGALPLLALMIVPVARGRRREALALWTAITLHVAYAGMTGGDWMPFQRFLLPVVPLAAVLSTWGLSHVVLALRDRRTRERAAALTLCGLALAFFAVHAHMSVIATSSERHKLSEATHVKHHTQHLLAAMDLARWLPRAAGERLVSDYAGVLAFFTEAQVIDMWGLCNETIALRGGAEGINPIYGKTCIECYAELDPDYFHVNVPLVRSATSFEDQAQVIDAVFQGPAIDRAIDLRGGFAVGRVTERATGRSLWFLERRHSDTTLQAREPAPGIRIDYPFESS